MLFVVAAVPALDPDRPAAGAQVGAVDAPVVVLGHVEVPGIRLGDDRRRVAATGQPGGEVPQVDTVQAATAQIDPGNYANPLPHVLTLTAIVVQIATLGVALALVTAVFRKYGSLDEDEVLKRIE